MTNIDTSSAESTLDALVQKASTPSLATLFKRAKEKGLITTITGYGPNKEKPADPNQAQPNTPQQGAPSAVGTATYTWPTSTSTGNTA